MLEIHRLRNNKEEVIERLKIRGKDFTKTIETILTLDAGKRDILQKLESNQARANSLAKEIGILYKSGEAEKANALKEETSQLKEVNKDLYVYF